MKSKKERALEIAIEQDLLKRDPEDLQREVVNDYNNKINRSSVYIKARTKLMLQWNKQKIN